MSADNLTPIALWRCSIEEKIVQLRRSVRESSWADAMAKVESIHDYIESIQHELDKEVRLDNEV